MGSFASIGKSVQVLGQRMQAPFTHFELSEPNHPFKHIQLFSLQFPYRPRTGDLHQVHGHCGCNNTSPNAGSNCHATSLDHPSSRLDCTLGGSFSPQTKGFEFTGSMVDQRWIETDSDYDPPLFFDCQLTLERLW